MAIVASAEAGLRASDRATILQLRAPGLTARALEAEARKLVEASPVPVLISSRCDIAMATGAAGVNLPEQDIATVDARTLLGSRLVGRSVHSRESARLAEDEGADFVIFGPVWATESHANLLPLGLDALEEMADHVNIPVLAIGGVNQERIAECYAAGARGFAAIRLFQ
jgi:thiamine-phosphate diphosphorylase